MTRAARRWLSAFGICALAVVVCILFIDRAAAEYFDERVVHSDAAVWIENILRPLDAVALLALIALVADGIRVMLGKEAIPKLRTVLLCAWATVWAVAAEVILKRVFGRGWPDPTYIGEHQYGFHWFHAGPEWESFPSGTAAVAAAIVAVAWRRESRWRARRRIRVIGMLAVLLVSVGVVVVNYHWISDVIAGSFVGALVGYLTVALMEESEPSVRSTGSRLSAPRPRSSI